MTPKRLGRYDLIRVLGKGSMGVVYEGRDPNLDRRVAIKTVRIENLSAQEVIEYEARFRTEARSAARLQHPNIVSVYDSDRDGDVAFLVMEFIEGEDLKHHLDQGLRYSLADALRIVSDLLGALDYAHRQGIVHRDIKPANLLIEAAGRVKLTDFGVARMQDSGEATRTQGGMVGTLKYMSPEQVQGVKVDSRSDLFSTGVLLYQLLTDVRPFDGEAEYAIIHRILHDEVTPPSSLNRALPFAVDAVVARALAKDRAQRFQSAQDFAVALQTAVRSSYDTTVVPPRNPRRISGEASSISGAQGNTGPRGLATDPATNPSGSTITQELELVYWKDVRETDDVHELQTFLRKFPMGLYADLARRRLRILGASSAPSDAGQGWPTQRDSGTWVLTRAYSRTEPGVVPGAVAQTEPSEAGAQQQPSATTPEPAEAPERPGVDESRRSGTIESAGGPDPTEAPALPVTGDGAEVQRPPSRRTAAIVAVTLVVVLAGAAALMSVRSGTEPVALPAPAAVPGVHAAGAPPLPAAALPATVTAEPDAVRDRAGAVVIAPTAAASAATAPRLAGSAVAGGRRQAASAALAGAAAATAAPASSAPPVRPVSRTSAPVPTTPVPVGPVIDPGEACKGRVLLGLESCLREQCETAASRDHPVCKQRREWDSWRKDSERARSNQGG